MPKFSAKNIEFKDDQQAIFGTDDDSYISWNGGTDQLEVSTTLSGVDPTEDGHLTTKNYVDLEIDTLSGSLIIPDDLIDLNDTPSSYSYGKYLRSTATSTVWEEVFGVAGADGGEWLSGIGAPTTATGSINNFYLDTSTGDIYRKESTATGTAQYGVMIEREADYSYTFADAIRFSKAGREVYVDNEDSAASFTGNWYSFSNYNAWDGTCRYATTSYGAKGVFNFVAPENADYDVYAWWPVYSNAGRNVPFTITHASGTNVVRKDQHVGTPQWNYLATHYFDGAAAWVWKMNIHGIDRPTTFSGLTDTPPYYDAGKYLISTSSGLGWTDEIDGGAFT